MGLFYSVTDKEYLRVAEEILGKEAKVSISCDGESIWLGCRYGHFSLRDVSGPVVVSRGLVVTERYRGQGWSGKFDQTKRRWCEMAGVELIIATVRHDNKAEVKAVAKHGWSKVGDLKDVGIWVTKPDYGFPDISYLT